MPESSPTVTFQPQGKTVRVRPGTRLMDAAAEAEITLDLPCGGEGVCGKCRLVARQGGSPPNAAERKTFDRHELDQGFRLACQTVVSGPMRVEVPESSVLASHYKILAPTGYATQTVSDPVVAKHYLELPPPRRGDDAADVARLEGAIGPLEIELRALRDLPDQLRAARFRGTAVLDRKRLLGFEPGDTTAESYGVAVDVGTTTLVALLLDLNTGQDLAVASRLNPQTAFGDDVLTRILHATERTNGLKELHRAVVKAVDEMIGELTEKANLARERIYGITFSGNTTMQQLLLGVDPGSLAEVPFVAAASRGVEVAAAELGVHVHPRGMACVLPVIGGFVGGDTVAGMLATGIVDTRGPALLVDIGTNGEIVLWAEGSLLAAATAAGPAFEGARITHGMRGSVGAIERVTLDDQLSTEVIGQVAPVGLCGSALIDLAAGLLRHGLLSPEGRLTVPDQLPANLALDVRRRIVANDGDLSFEIVSGEESGTGGPIVLTQRDVRQLQLASGAIRAGIILLLKRVGLQPADLETVLIAGGFGNFIRRRNAQRIGLIPAQIPSERIRFQGNTSLAGARLTSLSQSARRQAEELAARTKHIDLSTDPDFQWTFADAMIFPEMGR